MEKEKEKITMNEILEIIQKEIAQADKYEVVPLERIRIKIIQLYDQKRTQTKNL